MVPQNGIEPLTDAYKATVIPFNYKGMVLVLLLLKENQQTPTHIYFNRSWAWQTQGLLFIGTTLWIRYLTLRLRSYTLSHQFWWEILGSNQSCQRRRIYSPLNHHWFFFPKSGCLGRARTYDIRINSAAQLPTVLQGIWNFWRTVGDLNPWPHAWQACALTNCANGALVHPRRIELLFHPWKGCVLTVRRWVHQNIYYTRQSVFCLVTFW